MTTRVASMADYEAGYIPAKWRANEDRLWASRPEFDIVWMLDNETNLPVSLSIIDTKRSVYAEAMVVIVDPADQTTWTAALPTATEWLPCATDDDESGDAR